LNQPETIGQHARENESYAKRSCVDLKRGVMGRAPWSKNYTVPLPYRAACTLGFGPGVFCRFDLALPWCSDTFNFCLFACSSLMEYDFHMRPCPGVDHVNVSLQGFASRPFPHCIPFIGLSRSYIICTYLQSQQWHTLVICGARVVDRAGPGEGAIPLLHYITSTPNIG
jgi:hypothetical protein